MAMMTRVGTLIAAFLFVLSVAGAEEIHDAVAKGDLASVQAILTAQPDRIAAVDERGYTPLHVAAREGRIDIAAYLLEKGADIEAKNSTGYTPLFLAARSRRPDVVRLLLEKGADVKAQTRFQTTPLFTAVESGSVDVVGALIERGAVINHANPIFGSPLHRAAYMDFPEVAKLLLDRAADLSLTDQRGQTPLHQAAQLGRVAIARLFVERGADVNALDREGRTPLHLAVLYGTDRSGANRASELGFLLLASGARIATTDAEGGTPLLSAVTQGYTELVGAMLRKGGDLTAREPGTRRTLLHIAGNKGYDDMAWLLLARGVDPAAKDAFGKTAFDYACEHSHQAVAIRLAAAEGGTGGRVESGARILAKPMADGEAHVWLLNHRGWAVKTTSHLFVFDNEELGRKPDSPSLCNGWIAAPEIGHENVIALYSAYHALPGTMEFIHGLEDVLDRIVYVNYKDEDWRGGNKTVYVKGREVQRFGDVEVIPYETVDEGGMGSLGYLVKVDGMTIFYPNFYPEDLDAFKKEIDFLAGRTSVCDIAFIDVTPGQENAYAAYVVEKLKPRVVIPYDRSGKESARRELADELGRKHPGLQFGLVRDPGDRLHYRSEGLD